MKKSLISRRYFRQILTITIAVLLLLCLLASALLYANATHTTARSIAASEQERATELLRQADVYFNQFVSKNTVFVGLNIPYEQVGINADYWTRSLYERLIYSHLNADSYTKNIEISTYGKAVYPTKISHDRMLGKYAAFQIYTELEPSWPYCFDLCSSNRHGFVKSTITVSGYHLSKEFLPFKNEEREDYLIFPDGTIFLTNVKSAFFQNIEDVHPGLLDCVDSGEESLQKYNGSYAAITATDKYDFRIVSLVRKDVYSAQFYALTAQLLLMSTGLLTLALLISIFLTYRFYRPINNMIELLHTYIPDDLKNYESEIAFIDQNISKYVTKGAKLEKALPQALSKLQEAQAAVLQHQINSHFLFNTLENIKAISITELGIENEIEESIALLNNLVQETIQNRAAIVPLEKELTLAKSYLSLMQLRFPGVDVDWNIDDALLPCQVFKFSMQPVLENCFIHAFKNRQNRQNRISIRIFASGQETFTIRITDNGCGINETTLESIRKLLQETDDSSASHVGIRNVQNRIHTVFGESYGIHISSTPEETTVDIQYPITHTETRNGVEKQI